MRSMAFPCLLNGKADAQVMCVDPALVAYPNLTLLTNAHVSRLQTDATGRSITGVVVTRNGDQEQYSADIVVVACGALSSALLLLRSANDAHPNGLANQSGQVGRNYMRHNQSILMALLRKPNETVFQKTLAVSDFYFGADDWEFPAWSHPDVRHLPRRSDQGRILAVMVGVAAGNAVRPDGTAFNRFLAVV